MSDRRETTKPADAGPIEQLLGPLPECAWAAPQWITEDAYSAAQMVAEKKIGATEAMAQACNELSAALGWPNGVSAGPLPWADLLVVAARSRVALHHVEAGLAAAEEDRSALLAHLSALVARYDYDGVPNDSRPTWEAARDLLERLTTGDGPNAVLTGALHGAGTRADAGGASG